MNFYKLLTPLMLGINILSTSLALPSSKTELMKQDHFSKEKPLLLHRLERVVDEKPWFLDDSQDFKTRKLKEWNPSAESLELANDSVSLEEEIKSEESESLSFQEQEIALAKTKINELFSEIANPTHNTIYQDLFTPDRLFFQINDTEHIRFIKDKIIFKLSRIIEKKIESQFESGALYKPKSFEVYLQPAEAIIFSRNFNEYRLLINISLIKGANRLESWDQEFVWKNKLHYTKSNPNKKMKLIMKAANISLNINKKMFSEQPMFTNGWDLLYYLKGQLEELSINFKIEPWYKEKMALDLKSTDFQAHVYLNDKEVFDINLIENASNVNFDDPKYVKRNRILKHRSKQNQSFAIVKEQLETNFENLLAQMKLEYDGLWSKNDRIGEVTKTAKTLWYEIYGPEFAKDVSITSNLDPNTRLKRIMDESGNLDFTWIIATPNDILKYENLDSQTVRVENRFHNLQYWVNTHPYKLNSNFLYTKFDLVKLLQWKATTADYSLIIKEVDDEADVSNSLRATDFHLSVYDRIFNSKGEYKDKRIGEIRYYPYDSEGYQNPQKMSFFIHRQAIMASPNEFKQFILRKNDLSEHELEAKIAEYTYRYNKYLEELEAEKNFDLT